MVYLHDNKITDGMISAALAKRLDSGLSQEAICAAVGITIPTLTAAERLDSRRKIVKKTTRAALAYYYKCDISDMYEDDGTPKLVKLEDVSSVSRIFKERSKRGMTNREFSKLVSVNHMTLSNVEHKKERASEAVQLKISKALNMQPQELFDSEGLAI